MSASNWVHVTVQEIQRETDKALYVQLADGTSTWIPRSQISEGEKYHRGDKDVTLSITEWIANEKQIEGDD